MATRRRRGIAAGTTGLAALRLIGCFISGFILLLLAGTAEAGDGKCLCVDAESAKQVSERCEGFEEACTFSCGSTPGTTSIFYPDHKDCNPSGTDTFEGLMGRKNEFRRRAFGILNTAESEIRARWAGLMGEENILENRLMNLEDGGSEAEGIKAQKDAEAKAYRGGVFGSCHQVEDEKNRWECCIKPGVEAGGGNTDAAFAGIMGRWKECQQKKQALPSREQEIRGSAITEIGHRRQRVTDQLGAVGRKIAGFPGEAAGIEQEAEANIAKLWKACDCERKCEPTGDPKKKYGALLYCSAVCEDGGTIEEFCGVELHWEFNVVLF